jgi:hypothetical protein
LDPTQPEKFQKKIDPTWSNFEKIRSLTGPVLA